MFVVVPANFSRAFRLGKEGRSPYEQIFAAKSGHSLYQLAVREQGSDFTGHDVLVSPSAEMGKRLQHLKERFCVRQSERAGMSFGVETVFGWIAHALSS